MGQFLPRVRDVNLEGVEKVDTYVLYSKEIGYPIQFKFGEKSRKVAGILKLSQRFLKKLCTKVGTNPLDLAEGTDFMDLLGAGFADEDDINMAVQESIKEAER